MKQNDSRRIFFNNAVAESFIEWRDKLHKEMRGGKLMFDVSKHYKWLDESELLTYYLNRKEKNNMKIKLKDIKINEHPDYWLNIFSQCEVRIIPKADTKKWQNYKARWNEINMANIIISIIFNIEEKTYPYCMIKGLKGRGEKYIDTDRIVIYLDRMPFENKDSKYEIYATYKLKPIKKLNK